MSEIINCLYINLEKRKDRKLHVEQQLTKAGISFQRFNAIENRNGAIGCSLSHIKCLQIAKENNWESVIIVEDDITFLDVATFKNQLKLFFEKHDCFDVLLLAGNNMPPYQEVDETCIKVSRCQTTTGYLVKNHYYDILIDNFREGVRGLMKNPNQGNTYACDKYWFSLQQRDLWFLLIPLTIIQNPSYSNIEEKHTDYSKMMLDIDKKDFFRKLETTRNMFRNNIYKS